MIETVAPEPNAFELISIYRYIKAKPEEWNQVSYVTKRRDCGTAFCFAGHAVNRAGGVAVFDHPDSLHAYDVVMPDGDGMEEEIPRVAERILGIDEDQAYVLFRADNDLEDLREVIIQITGLDPEKPCPGVIPGDEIIMSDL